MFMIVRDWEKAHRQRKRNWFDHARLMVKIVLTQEGIVADNKILN